MTYQTHPRPRWPRRRMVVAIDMDTDRFFRGLVLGLALSFAFWGLAFAAWSLVR